MIAAALLSAAVALPAVAAPAPVAAAAPATVGACSNGWQELFIPNGSFNDIPQGAVTRNGALEWIVGGSHRGPMMLKWNGSGLVAKSTGSDRRRGLADGVSKGPGVTLVGGFWRPSWGAEISPLLGRIGGTVFKRDPVAVSARTNAAVADVVTLPNGHGWAVGTYLAKGRWKALSLYRTGGRWVQRNPFPSGGSGLLGVAKTPKQTVWAAGWRVRDGKMRPLVLRRDAKGWKSISTAWLPPGPAVLTDIAVPQGGKGWTIGYLVKDNGAKYTPILESWNGKKWTRVAIPWADASAIPQSLHATREGELWVAGTQLATSNRETRGFVAHRQDGAWTMRYIDTPAEVRSSLQSVDATRDGAVVTGTIAATALVLRTCDSPGAASKTRAKISIAGIKKRRQAKELHELSGSMPVIAPTGSTFRLAAPVPATGFVIRDMAAAAGLAESTRTFKAHVADFDNNGWKDVFISRHQGPPRLALNEGGSFSDAPNTAFGPFDRHDCAVSDVDANGWKDILCVTGRRYGTSVNHHELSLDVAGPDPRSDRLAGGISDPLGRGRDVALLKVDGDVYPEAFIVAEPEREDVYPVTNRFYRNYDGKFKSAPGKGLDRPVGGYCADGSDIDGDRDHDLLVCARFPYDGRAPGLRIYRNFGGRLLERSKQLGIKPIGDTDVALAHINGDGRRDLIQMAGNRVRVNKRTATGFKKVLDIKIDKAVAIATGDVNGDKRADIYVVRGGSDMNRNDRLLINNGKGTAFTSVVIPQVGTGQGRGDDVVALDYDKNGRTDFVVLNGKGVVAGPIQLLAAFPKE